MKKLLILSPFFIILSFLSIQKAYSHSGRTNSSGCHNNRKTGGYHCHNGGYIAPPIYQKPEINIPKYPKPKINPPKRKKRYSSIKEKINSPREIMGKRKRNLV